MKKLITVFVLLLCYCVPVFASEQEAINSFTAVVNQIEREIKQTYTDEYAKTYYNSSSNYWFKSRNANLEVFYDIRKNDSLISPYNGILRIKFDALDYIDENNPNGKFKTEAEAINAKSKKIGNKHSWVFLYAYQNKKWVLRKMAETFLGDTFWQDVNEDNPVFFPVMLCKNK